MALSTRTTTLNVRPVLVGAVLAMALLFSLLGGVIGGIVADLATANTTGGEQPQVVVLDPKWVAYGNDWEQRYRQMYPAITR